MVPTLRYIILTCKHKWFVFIAGLRIRVPLWLLITHDLSKFGWHEAPHYGRQFFGASDDPLGFSFAWNNHQKRNKHHWEYWVMVSSHNRGGFPDGSALPMPDRYAREMVADWIGASRAYEGKWPASLSSWPWFSKNFDGLNLHVDTRFHILKILSEGGLHD